MEEQLQEAQLSPYLDDLDRQALLELMAPRATPRPRSPRKLPETTKEPVRGVFLGGFGSKFVARSGFSNGFSMAFQWLFIGF